MKTAPYNPFDYLNTPEEVNAFLEEAFTDPDPRAALIALGHLARKKGMSRVSEQCGIPRESLYRALSGGRNPGFDTVMKVARALGVEIHACAH